MCESIRKTGKPCLAFKILAGGWGASNAEQTGKSFLVAFQNIKPSDGVIVGMLPAFTDQVSENVRHTVECGSGFSGSDQ